jgi:hypothetical protein
MRLTEDVYLVGGGSANGFGLSGELDSHVMSTSNWWSRGW